MLFIVFGTRVRQKVLGEGEFYCPKCGAQRAYKHKKASRYFSLYFVPIIPIGQLGEFVECQTCGMVFEPRVLDMKAPPTPRISPADLPRLINSLPQRLSAGQPVEYLIRDLTAAGVDREAAMTLIEPHLLNGRKTCATCGLTYAASVSSCAECGQPLA